VAREQQKIFLTPEARQRLRDEAEKRGWEMSEIVEYLLVKGTYPPVEQEA
jgi:hypothetical protein